MKVFLAVLALLSSAARADELDALYPSLDALYQELHRNPELSWHEVNTAAKMAARLRAVGFQVTEHVGGHGVVGVLRNGAGPTLLVRTEMDALPIVEQTGLPYASKVTTTTDTGETVGVMHACGHDIHMTAWVGAATLLAHARNRWHGTLLFVAQPAEEVLAGVAAMMKDRFAERFPRPDYVLAVHDTSVLPAGQIGVTAGAVLSASNAVDITFHGTGGHGARPHLAVDPIVMAARAVVTLQTIVAREVNPFDPAVVTVGTFHAGSKRNVIPDDARLELTVRSFKPEVQKQMLAAIARIARAEAAAAGAPREPDVVVLPDQAADVLVNDPALTARLSAALRRSLGAENVVDPLPPDSGSEDFGVFGRVAGAPSVMLRVGAVERGELASARAAGKPLPGLHSARFAPDRERTIRGGVAALTTSALELLGGKIAP